MLIIRQIKEYSDYLITSEGEVWSFKSNRPKVILRPQYRKGGYVAARLYKNNKARSFSVHRLVAEAFLPNPNNLPQVNHIDGDKENNSLVNLEWTTAKENKKHSMETGLWSPNFGVENGMAKISKEDVANIREIYSAGGISQKALGIKYGVSQATIWSLLHRHTWK